MGRKFLYSLASCFLLLQLAACMPSNQQAASQTPRSTASATGGNGFVIPRHASSSPQAIATTTAATQTPAQATASAASAQPPAPTAVMHPPMATPAPAATTPANPGMGAPTTQEKQLAAQLLARINQDRAANQNGAAYRENAILSNGAYQHSLNMARTGLAHTCPGEAPPDQRVLNEGISYMAFGENVGYSSPNPDSWGGVQVIESSMLAERPPDAGHRDNLLSTTFHQIGVGVHIDSKGLVWVTEDFVN